MSPVRRSSRESSLAACAIWRYAAVVMMKPGGTGNPARLSRARLSPLPPHSARPTTLARSRQSITVVVIKAILLPVP